MCATRHYGLYMSTQARVSAPLSPGARGAAHVCPVCVCVCFFSAGPPSWRRLVYNLTRQRKFVMVKLTQNRTLHPDDWVTRLLVGSTANPSVVDRSEERFALDWLFAKERLENEIRHFGGKIESNNGIIRSSIVGVSGKVAVARNCYCYLHDASFFFIF